MKTLAGQLAPRRGSLPRKIFSATLSAFDEREFLVDHGEARASRRQRCE